MGKEEANTVKLITIMLLILGLIIPLWPISLPICWYFAYKSYKKGEPSSGEAGGGGSLDEIKKAKDLFDAGAIDLGEYEKIKRRHLS